MPTILKDFVASQFSRRPMGEHSGQKTFKLGSVPMTVDRDKNDVCDRCEVLKVGEFCFSRFFLSKDVAS